jgi:hypothetical protein
METLLGADHIPPFWSRLPEVYKYPLNTEAITTLLVVSLVAAMIGNFSIFLIIPMAAMVFYSFACLRETAKGNLKPPGLEACFESSVAPLYVVIVIFVLGIAANIVFSYFGRGIGILALLCFIAALPASIMIIATEERLLPAINPAELAIVIRAAGSSYFVMLLFVLIMSSSVFALQSFIGGSANSFFGIFVQSLISNYYGVVVYHLMGYLVYQNQEALGFKTKKNRSQASFRSDEDRAKSHLEVLIKAGEYRAAADLARAQLQKSSATLWDWARAFSLMCIAGPSDKASLMFDDYAKRLEQAGEADTLAEAYLELKKRRPGFVIKDHKQRLFVATTLFETGEYAKVVNMLHLFHQQSEDTTQITHALKLLTESLSSISGREKLARQYQALYQNQLTKA